MIPSRLPSSIGVTLYTGSGDGDAVGSGVGIGVVIGVELDVGGAVTAGVGTRMVARGEGVLAGVVALVDVGAGFSPPWHPITISIRTASRAAQISHRIAHSLH